MDLALRVPDLTLPPPSQGERTPKPCVGFQRSCLPSSRQATSNNGSLQRDAPRAQWARKAGPRGSAQRLQSSGLVARGVPSPSHSGKQYPRDQEQKQHSWSTQCLCLLTLTTEIPPPTRAGSYAGDLVRGNVLVTGGPGIVPFPLKPHTGTRILSGPQTQSPTLMSPPHWSPICPWILSNRSPSSKGGSSGLTTTWNLPSMLHP